MESIKIRENKSASGVASGKFYITYANKGNINEHRKKSFEILSRLKGEREVLVELNSSLLSLDIFKREKCALDFLKGVKELGLNFRSRKVPSKESQSIISKIISMGQAPKDSYEIITHVTNDTWNDAAFKAMIPNNGVMYYVCKENPDAIKQMEDMFNGQVFDEEKFSMFEFFVYDCIDFGQMGVFTDKLSLSDLEKMLRE